jgi:hypothetical protein
VLVSDEPTTGKSWTLGRSSHEERPVAAQRWSLESRSTGVDCLRLCPVCESAPFIAKLPLCSEPARKFASAPGLEALRKRLAEDQSM